MAEGSILISGRDPRDLRVPDGSSFMIYSSGYQIARYCPQQHDWLLCFGGVEVGVTEIISKLTELQTRLNTIRGSDAAR